MGVMVSPLTGAEGNVEFLLHARVGPGAGGQADFRDAVDAAVAQASEGRGV